MIKERSFKTFLYLEVITLKSKLSLCGSWLSFSVKITKSSSAMPSKNKLIKMLSQLKS